MPILFDLHFEQAAENSGSRNVVPAQQQQPPWELATNAESPAAPRPGEIGDSEGGAQQFEFKTPSG